VIRSLIGTVLVTMTVLTIAAAAATQPPRSAVELGEITFNNSGCFGCHTIGKIGTPLAPDLSHVGSKYPAEYIARWLRDPSFQRPNAHMPAFELTEAQVRALAAYLGSLE
jgi:mono/diheme cytochrome c family protein